MAQSFCVTMYELCKCILPQIALRTHTGLLTGCSLMSGIHVVQLFNPLFGLLHSLEFINSHSALSAKFEGNIHVLI